MIPGADPMGAPTSFTARRPNASTLPNFELPPPQLAAFQGQNKYSFPMTSGQSNGNTLTSVGNLLTPPSNSSADGLSPISTASMGNQGVNAYSGGMWAPSGNTGTTPYGFQTSSAPPFGRGLYSPSLNSIVRGSPAHSDAAPSSYDLPFSGPSMTGSSLSSSHGMMSNGMIGTPGSAASVSQASPVNSHDSFSRQPPTPTYYGGQNPANQQSFPYSGASSIHQSPISAGGPMSKMSPVNGHGQIPSLHAQQPQYNQHRYSYGATGPVLSNVNNPNSHMSLMHGGMQHGMPMAGYNSGHAAHMGHMYGNQGTNMHTERPFKCDQCPQSFNRNHDLKRHKRIHLAVKPFPCGHCDKSFSRKDALKRHMLVKGCGRADRHDSDLKADGSISPISQSGSISTSPTVLPASA